MFCLQHLLTTRLLKICMEIFEMRPGAKLAKKWVFPQCNLLSEVLLFSRTVLSAIQRSWKKNSLIVIGKTPGNNLAPNWNTCMKLDATKWENIGIMWWAQKDGVHFLKRLWNKVQQLGDGFNTIHQESVHLMWSLKMHISASLQWLMKFSQKIAFNKANRRMKWMLKTNNIFYVWAIRLGLAWCGLSIFGRLMKVKTFFSDAIGIGVLGTHLQASWLECCTFRACFIQGIHWAQANWTWMFFATLLFFAPKVLWMPRGKFLFLLLFFDFATNVIRSFISCCAINVWMRLMKKVEKTDWSTMLIALSDNFSFENRGTINRMTLPEILKAIQEKIGFDPEDRSVLNNAD